MMIANKELGKKKKVNKITMLVNEVLPEFKGDGSRQSLNISQNLLPLTVEHAILKPKVT